MPILNLQERLTVKIFISGFYQSSFCCYRSNLILPTALYFLLPNFCIKNNLLLSSLKYKLFNEKSLLCYYYQTLSNSPCAFKQNFSNTATLICPFSPIQEFTFFFIQETLRKMFLEYCQISKRYLQKRLEKNLGKASSLLKNVRNSKHVSKKQTNIPWLVWHAKREKPVSRCIQKQIGIKWGDGR